MYFPQWPVLSSPCWTHHVILSGQSIVFNSDVANLDWLSGRTDHLRKCFACAATLQKPTAPTQLLSLCSHILPESMEGIPSVHKSLQQASSQAGKVLHPLTYDFKRLEVSGLEEKTPLECGTAVKKNGNALNVSTVRHRNSHECAGFHQSADHHGDGHHPGSFSQGQVCHL